MHEAFEESFSAALELFDEDCHNFVLPVVDLFDDMQNVTAAAVCLPVLDMPGNNVFCMDRSLFEMHLPFAAD